MAGDWLKVEVELPDKPEVWEMAGILGIDPDAVVGKLIKVWRWFDAHTVDGNAHGVTYPLLDSKSGVTGFAEAMALVGWLVQDGRTLRLPKFDRHNGKTAKNRALTAKRVKKNRNADVTPEALPREEKRREEEKQDQKKERAPNGSRLPDDWTPSEADIAFAKKERPDVSWQAEADKFRDYWHGVAGAKGRKADWPGTWRNWIRRADGRKQPSGQALSKTAQAFLKLEGMRNGTVDSGRSDAGDAKAALPWLGPAASDGID